MKKLFSSLILALFVVLGLSFFSSCKEDPEPEDPGTTQPEPIKVDPGMFTFTASPLKGKWEEGDKIYIHGSYGPAAQMITLAASDISADGKIASAYLDKVTEYPVKPDGLYAAWPGELASTDTFLPDQKTTFPRADTLITVAYLDGSSFVFEDAVCGLSFKVSGYTDYIIATNTRTGLGFSSFEIEHTSIYSSFFKFVNDGEPFLPGKLTDGSAIVWFPGAQSFYDGYTIYFGDGTSWPVCYTVSSDVTLQRGVVTDLGDITSALGPFDGPGPNMPKMGSRSKYTVKFNELSGLCLSADGSFLWGVDDNGGIGKISFTGEVSEKRSFGGEFEAVILDPATGDLLIGEETSPAKVSRVAGPDFNKKTTQCVIKGTTGMDNAGLEGLTYYKDGLAYAGMQTGAYLYLFNIETGELQGERKGLRQFFPTITEVGDLCYDPLTDWLWVLDSETKKITVLTGDAKKLLGVYSVKGIANPEALFVDHLHSCIWVGDDYGSTSYLYRYDFTGLDDAIISQ